ncbi:MAG: hypothetical protein E7032_05565 [Akkermansiaceae bacterium]|nr:hypothetical protein [Akkermansiaceae bacterium]
MSKPIIKVAFVDFAPTYSEKRLLSWFERDFTPIVDEDHPDIIVFSCFGFRHLDYPDALRIFFSGENLKPDFSTCDYSLGCVKMDYRGKHLWVPFSNYKLMNVEPNLPPISSEMARRKFCSFIYSQDKIGEGTLLRIRFCEQLMRDYKHVDCPGRVLHNLDAPELAARNDAANWLESKRRFLSNYKFNIAFENSAAPGYITEKLSDAFLGNTVPIYWGSDGDSTPFPKEAMICANDYPTLEALIERIKEVDENDELYLRMLAANPLRPENKCSMPDCLKQIQDFMYKAVQENIREHQEPRVSTINSLYREFEEYKRHPYVRAGMKVYRGVQKLKRLLGLKKA